MGAAYFREELVRTEMVPIFRGCQILRYCSKDILKALGHDINFEVHGAQERKFAAHAGPSIARSGLHTVNKLLTVLLLRAPMCRAGVGRRFREDKAVPSSYSKMRIMLYYAIFNRPVCNVTSCVGARSNYYF